MDTSLIGTFGDMVAKIGLPGTILLVLAWAGKQLLPIFIKHFEGLNESLASIATDIKDMRADIKTLVPKGA